MDKVDRVIEARFLARRQLVPLLVLVGFAAYTAVLWSFDRSSWWLLLLAVVELGVVVPLGVYVAVRSQRSGWVLRLDQHGVTVRGAEPVPWTDLTGIALGPLKPFPAFTVTRWTECLAFVPRAGVELPGPPHHRGRPQVWGSGFRRRFYGTNLIILPHAMSVSAEEVIGASRHWGELEVRRARHRRWLGPLLFLLACVLLGGIVALVISLF